MIQNVIVLGGGSAGFLAAIALKKHLPKLDVTVIRSRDIGIIGVGEGTTVGFARFLHENLNIGLKKFWEVARPTWKLGLRLEWGPTPYFNYPFTTGVASTPPGLSRPAGYYSGMNLDNIDIYSALMSADKVFEPASPGVPKLHRALAYHFENKKFVAYLEQLSVAYGVKTLDDTVEQVVQDDAGITGLTMHSTPKQHADLYVDCSGFHSILLAKALGERFISYDKSLFCDRAVIGGWQRTDEIIKPYTNCQTMNSGWCWQIEHEDRINRGYVYSSAFISDEEADREFREKNPKIDGTRVVRFISGRYERSWVKNVVAIGNASGFVEPLEASALGVIAAEVANLVGTLQIADLQPREIQLQTFNDAHARIWDVTRDFLSIHYKFNRRIDTPFWRFCQENTDLAGAAAIVEWYRQVGPSNFWEPSMFDPHDSYRMGGYATLLMGLGVPFHNTYRATDQETTMWRMQREKHRRFARSALGVGESLRAIHSEKWAWAN